MVMQIPRCLAEKTRIGLLEGIAVLQIETEQRRQIIDFDIAVHIGGGKTDSTALHGFAEHAEIVEAQHRVPAGRRIANGTGAPIGKYHRYGAMFWMADKGRTDRVHEPGNEPRPRSHAGAGIVYCCLVHWPQRSNLPT